MAEEIKKYQYLDETGLRTFYGLIKDQWEAADEILKADLEGQLAEAIATLEAADTTLGESLATEATTREEEDKRLAGLIGDNANNITSLVTALSEEVTARTEADNELDGKITTLSNTHSTDKTELEGKITAASNKAAEDLTSAVETLNTTISGNKTEAANNLSAAVETLNTSISNEATARAEADTALDGRIKSLEAGATNPQWLTDEWLTKSIDNATIKLSDGNKISIKLPNGETLDDFTPKIITADLSLTREGNTIALSDGKGATHGSVDLSSIVLDRVLTAGAVVYDEKDIENNVDGGSTADGFTHPEFPYIVFTIATYDNGTKQEGTEYVRVSVKDLVDEYTGSDFIEIVRTTDAGNPAARSIKITDGFVGRVTNLETAVGELEAADISLGERIDSIETSLGEAVEALEAADVELGGRIDGEITNRTNAIATAKSEITTAYTEADTALGGRIDGEITARTEADTALGERIDGVMEAVQNIVDNQSHEPISDDLIKEICGIKDTE